MKIGILGGGLSAVTLQKFLEIDSQILEKEDRLGGLCRSFEKEGFTYDIGGHILFSKDDSLMDVIKNILGKNIHKARRENKVLFKDIYVKYPFENGLGVLDKQDIYECLVSYIQNNNPSPGNFREWIFYAFGNGIAEKYLVPYNEKIWKSPLDNMDIEWVERVPKPPVQDILKSAVGIETEGYLHQLYFLYPQCGGIESLVKSVLKDNADYITNFDIKIIKKSGKGWLVSNGEQEKYYEKIVITFPIKEAVKCFEGIPGNVVEAVSNLKHNRIRVVLVGVDNESLLDKTAVYVPQKDVIPHRLCYMGCFSKNNVPGGKSSLIAEVTTNESYELYDTSDDVLVEKVVNDLDRINIINKQDVCQTDIANIEYAYVVYDRCYQENIKIVKKYFTSIGVNLLGRFAEFEYINMDEVLRRSINLSEKINDMEKSAKA